MARKPQILTPPPSLSPPFPREEYATLSIYGNSIDCLVPRLVHRSRVRKRVEAFWNEGYCEPDAKKPYASAAMLSYVGARWANIGCGPDTRFGPQWSNHDNWPSRPEVSKLDMTKVPWPIETASLDRVLADQVFEHLPHYASDGRDAAIAALTELGRVLKPGGRAIIGTPDAWGMDAWSNITHYRGFNERTVLSAIEDKEAANQAQASPMLRQVGTVSVKRGKFLGVDTSYHFPKYLKWEPNVGTRWLIYYLLEHPIGTA